MENAIPLYLNWSFWAVIVATLALVLSQLPPISSLIKKAKLDLELYSKIAITHKVGNPNLQLHLIISNIGGRKVKIKAINASLKKDNKHLVTLPAQNYLQNQADKNTVLFTPITLMQNNEWAHIINFLNFFSRDEEIKYNELETKMLFDYRKRSNLTKKNEDDPELIELSEDVVAPAIPFFDEHFLWKTGEYLLELTVITDKKSTDITKNYRFTIFETQENQLKSITEYFKYGGGFWWNPEIPTNIILEIKEA